MICLTCKTPLVASAIHKTLTPTRFEMTVGCTCCHAVYKIEQLELRPADPERLKLFSIKEEHDKDKKTRTRTGTAAAGNDSGSDRVSEKGHGPGTGIHQHP